MSDYWGIPEKEYELSLLQFAKRKLSAQDYEVLSEKVEVCSGAGALTLTAVLVANHSRFGLYINDGPKQRKSRGPPIIKVLKLLEGMNNAEDLRNFMLTHQNDFHTILSPKDKNLIENIKRDIKIIYLFLYESKIKDLYDSDLSSAADVLRKRLRRVITEL